MKMSKFLRLCARNRQRGEIRVVNAQRKDKKPCNEELSPRLNATIDLFDGVMLPARSHDKISVLAKTESRSLWNRPQPTSQF